MRIRDAVEAVADATGIALASRDLMLARRGRTVALRAFGAKAVSFRLEPRESIARGLREAIALDGADRVRERIVAARVAMLRRALAPAVRAVRRRLRGLKGAEELDFAVRDLGYDHRHYTVPEEVERGWPTIALVVSAPDDREAVFEIDPREPRLDPDRVAREVRLMRADRP
jgi:hypothetical protein